MNPVLLQWRKSSYSSDTANCVEVASSLDFIHVRDSKDSSLTAISYATASWRTFIDAVRADAFDGPTRRD
jgi:hypothetical protein